MLCSNCGQLIRPVVAVDIDGTLGDYHGHFSSFAANFLDVSFGYRTDKVFTRYQGGEPYKEWFCRMYDCDETTFRAVKLAYRQGGMKRTMPMFEGADEFVRDLRADAEVWLATTRPHERFDRIDPDTKEWLRRNDIRFDALYFGDDKMQQVAQAAGERLVAFVDDEVTNLLQLPEPYEVGILAGNPANMESPWQGVRSGAGFPYSIILDKIKSWSGKVSA